jgi:hypothetical protein
MTLTSFIQDETGAVTVDWVVLTAALVGLGFAVMNTVADGAGDLATDMNDTLLDVETEIVFTQADAGEDA